MKVYLKSLMLFFTLILPLDLISQNGYQKSIKVPYSNVIISSQLYKDKLYCGGLANSNFVDFHVGNYVIDTIGSILNYQDTLKIINKQVSFGGQSSRNILIDSIDSTYTCIYVNGGILINKYSIEDSRLLNTKRFRYRVDKSDNHTPFGILKQNDKYLIYGKIQLEGNGPTVTFVLVTDNNLNELYWKLIYADNDPEKNDGLEARAACILNNGNLLLGTLHIIKPLPPFPPSLDAKAILYEINLENKEVVRKNIIGNKNNLMFICNLFEINNKINIISYQRDSTAFIYRPSLSILTENYNEESNKFFGNQDLVANKQYGIFEWPYQSTMDNNGNIYATTLSYKFDPPHIYQDSTATEILTLTKFNSKGDIVWETQDIFDKNELNYKSAFINPYIASVNVAESGSIFITGYYQDNDYVDTILTIYNGPYQYFYYDSLLMIDTFEIRDTIIYDTVGDYSRVAAFIMKYDKDGCRVSGCRIVDTQEEAIKEEKLVIYPNPTNDKIHLTSSVNWLNAKVSIVDVQGKTWMDFKHNHRDDIDVSNLPPGIYTFTLEKDGNVQREKFIKL